MALLFLASTVSYAGALLDDPLEKSSPALKKRTEPMGTAVGGAGNVTPIVKEPKLIQKITCWQNGELILEHAVIAPKDKVTDMRLLPSHASSPEMLAMDFKNAFCFIK
jgi:hypothetical protein